MKTAEQGLTPAYGRFPTIEEFRRLEPFSRVEIRRFREPGAGHGTAIAASPSDDDFFSTPAAFEAIVGRSK
jgi:hypothetical protein